MDAAVALAGAYLRLAGYFLLTEIPVRVRDRDDVRTATDLDILAIRPPHAAELVPVGRGLSRDTPLIPDPLLDVRDDVTDVIVAEVKRGAPALNPSLFDLAVLRFALRRTGCCPVPELDAHAGALLRRGTLETKASGHACRARLVAFGRGATGHEPARALSIDLDRCVDAVRAYLGRERRLLHGTYFTDPVLNVMSLLEDLGGAVARPLERTSV